MSVATPLKREVRRASFSRFSEAEMEIVVRELHTIASREGEVRVSRIIELAADRRHPLHAILYRDSEAVAASKYRVELARQMCRAARVVYMDDDGKVVANVPMLISVTKRDGEDEVEIRTPRYITAERAYADPSIRRAMAERALLEIERWQARHAEIDALAPIFKSIEKVRRSIESRAR